MKKKTIEEARLSKNLSAPFIKAFKSLGLNDEEILYYTSLYEELRKNGLVNSNYFNPKQPTHPNIQKDDFVLDYDGELPDIKQLQAYAKNPEMLIDYLHYVVHNPKFLRDYDIELIKNDSGKLEDVIINKVKHTEKKEVGRKSTFMPEIIVAEFDDWVVYNPKTGAQKGAINTKYLTHSLTQSEKDYLNSSPEGINIQYFSATWCTAQKGSSYFNSYKQNKAKDEWYVTITKDNALEIYNKHVKDKYPEGAFSGYSGRQKFAAEIGDKYISETFLKDGTAIKTAIVGRAYGIYPFRNSGSAMSESELVGVSVDYDNLTSVTEPFEIRDNVLEKVNKDEEIIIVPLGVRTVSAGAFVNKPNVKIIVLPITTLYIETGAIKNLPNLEKIFTSNNLEVIEEKALDNIGQHKNESGVVLIGVPREDGTLDRPARLRYIQRDLLREYKEYYGGKE